MDIINLVLRENRTDEKYVAKRLEKNGFYRFEEENINRYFEHPIYQYHICGVYGENNAEALLVYREQKYNHSAAIRVVDYIGNHECFSRLGDFFSELLRSAEYVDFYCCGFEDNYIIQAGFSERTDEDPNIIPDHFSPFENRNVDIFVNSPCDNCLFFKADGDQDRPSDY